MRADTGVRVRTFNCATCAQGLLRCLDATLPRGFAIMHNQDVDDVDCVDEQQAEEDMQVTIWRPFPYHTQDDQG